MDGIAIARRPRHDRAAWSLADLIILVAGCAVAMSLPWMRDPWALVWVVPEPDWYVPLAIANEVLTKASVALLPLAIWKRAQLGGVIRPGEFLFAVCSAALLAEMVGRLDWIRDSYYEVELPNDRGSYSTPGGPYWYVHLAGTAVAAGSMLALIFLRKRMPMWARSTLLTSAYAGAIPWIPYGLVDSCAGYITPPLISRMPFLLIAIFSICMFPFFLIPTAIAMAALLDRLRGRPASPLEWIGSAIGLTALALTDFMRGYSGLFNRTSPIEEIQVSELVGFPLSSWVLGLVVAWRFGPALGRWVGAGEAVDGRSSRLDRREEIA